jgi:oligopeptide transport system ATP-binding protein
MLLDVKELKTEFVTADGIVNAVNGISYSVDEGCTLGIVGESGCGKSVSVLSLLRLLPKSIARVSGEALFNSRNLLTLPNNELTEIRGNKIAMIFQDPMTCLNPVLTIGDQISEAVETHMNLSKTDAKIRAIEMLQMVGIPSAEMRFNDYPHKFSGGMRQRVMIAMALSCKPSLLIADEPTTALDVTIQSQIVELVKRLRDELGMAIVWITHDLAVIAGLADKIAVMYAGLIVEEADVDTLYENPKHPYTIGLLNALPRVDGKRGTRLTSIDGFPPDLINLPLGCPFYKRCNYHKNQCIEERPILREYSSTHKVACWVNL